MNETDTQNSAQTTQPEASIAGAAAFAGAETAEILNLLGDSAAGGSCCGGSCCAPGDA